MIVIVLLLMLFGITINGGEGSKVAKVNEAIKELEDMGSELESKISKDKHYLIHNTGADSASTTSVGTTTSTTGAHIYPLYLHAFYPEDSSSFVDLLPVPTKLRVAELEESEDSFLKYICHGKKKLQQQ